MTANQLIQANAITKELDALKAHRYDIENRTNRNDSLKLYSYNYGASELNTKFFPIAYKDFFDLYISKITQRITELNQELLNL